MIRNGNTYCGIVSRTSMFSESDGLNPVGFSRISTPLENVPSLVNLQSRGHCTIRYVSDYAEGDSPMYGYFGGSPVNVYAEKDGTFEFLVETDSDVPIDSVMIYIGNITVSAFDVTLKGLAFDGVSYAEIGTVHAGLSENVGVSTLRVFSSYGEGSHYGTAGTVLCRFHNDSFTSRKYKIIISGIGMNRIQVGGVLVYLPSVSPMSSFDLTSSTLSNAIWSDVDSMSGYSNVSFNDGMIFNNASSYIRFHNTFLYGIEDFTVSFSLKFPSLSDGAVMSYGSNAIVSASTLNNMQYISFLGNPAVEYDVDEWHRVTVERAGSHNVIRIDGNEIDSVRSRNTFMFHSMNESLSFGGSSGMMMKHLCFYDFAIGRDGASRELKYIR